MLHNNKNNNFLLLPPIYNKLEAIAATIPAPLTLPSSLKKVWNDRFGTIFPIYLSNKVFNVGWYLYNDPVTAIATCFFQCILSIKTAIGMETKIPTLSLTREQTNSIILQSSSLRWSMVVPRTSWNRYSFSHKIVF